LYFYLLLFIVFVFSTLAFKIGDSILGSKKFLLFPAAAIPKLRLYPRLSPFDRQCNLASLDETYLKEEFGAREVGFRFVSFYSILLYIYSRIPNDN
jgi:hypothetical protein